MLNFSSLKCFSSQVPAFLSTPRWHYIGAREICEQAPTKEAVVVCWCDGYIACTKFYKLLYNMHAWPYTRTRIQYIFEITSSTGIICCNSWLYWMGNSLRRWLWARQIDVYAYVVYPQLQWTSSNPSTYQLHLFTIDYNSILIGYKFFDVT